MKGEQYLGNTNKEEMNDLDNKKTGPRKGLALTAGLVVGGAILLIFLGTAHASDGINPVHPNNTPLYTYRMKGAIRLLFFWLGRDDVGGGTISILSKPGSQPGSRREVIEVLFGSKPERVPGKVNRWGYGREWADWRLSESGTNFKLQRTVFEGFMSHSDEESLAQVRRLKNESGKEQRLFWFVGIRSSVLPGEAVSEIHIFSDTQDFDFRQPQRVRGRYQERVQSGPPDRMRRFVSDSNAYGTPYGFLTATHALIQEISRNFEVKESGWQDIKPSLTYVYNGRPHHLSVGQIKHLRGFRLSSREKSTTTLKHRTFSDVAKVEFRDINLQKQSKHNFEIWFALRGSLQGIPLRIVAKPRWWLRLELNLELEEGSEQTKNISRP